MSSGDLADQVAELKAAMRAIQLEVAALRHPLAREDRIMAATMELEAIVQATETATNKILATAEQIGQAADAIAVVADDEAVTPQLDAIGGLVADLFTHCSFQDITGQRVAKVIRTLEFVEARIHAMIATWDQDEFNALEPPGADGQGDQALLNGPQLERRGVSQADIDAMFP